MKKWIALWLLATGSVAAVAAPAAHKGGTPAYLNTSLSPEARAAVIG
jgi:DNA-nicking Smr family endonuclease